MKAVKSGVESVKKGVDIVPIVTPRVRGYHRQ